jgi:hypothetical protein
MRGPEMRGLEFRGARLRGMLEFLDERPASRIVNQVGTGLESRQAVQILPGLFNREDGFYPHVAPDGKFPKDIKGWFHVVLLREATGKPKPR